MNPTLRWESKVINLGVGTWDSNKLNTGNLFSRLMRFKDAPLGLHILRGGVSERSFAELAQRGVMPDIVIEEPWYLCYEHGDEEIAETLTAFEDAVKAVKAAS